MRDVFRRIFNALAIYVSLTSVLFVCGCSTFERDWRNAALAPIAPGSVEGRWEGHWKSEVNGHTGKLRCLLTKQDETRCEARFKATYWKVLRFTYTATLAGEERDGAWRFNGSADLGKAAGGVYRYEGQATATNFHSTYRSEYDHGVFEMRRPE